MHLLVMNMLWSSVFELINEMSVIDCEVKRENKILFGSVLLFRYDLFDFRWKQYQNSYAFDLMELFFKKKLTKYFSTCIKIFQILLTVVLIDSDIKHLFYY